MRERSGAFIRHLLRGTGILLAAMVLSMACGEGVLRLCPASVLPADLQQGLRAAPHDVGLSHPTIGVLEYPFQTGVFAGPDMQAVYHTDGHGFRNPSPWPPEADIVVLGDSVAFGYGVEDTQAWPALLAQWLTPQRVLNLGLIDAGPQQYLHVYETFQRALHPRVVLVGLSLATDFDDAELFDRWWRTTDRENYRVWKTSEPLRLAHPLDTFHTLVSRYSYLFRIVGSSGARVTPFRCLDGVWLSLFPDQLEAARVKAHPDQQRLPSGAAGATPSARAGAGAGGVCPRRVPAEQGRNLSAAAESHGARPPASPAGRPGAARYCHARPHPGLSSPGSPRGAPLLSSQCLSEYTGTSIDRAQCVPSSDGTGTDQTRCASGSREPGREREDVQSPDAGKWHETPALGPGGARTGALRKVVLVSGPAHHEGSRWDPDNPGIPGWHVVLVLLLFSMNASIGGAAWRADPWSSPGQIHAPNLRKTRVPKIPTKCHRTKVYVNAVGIPRLFQNEEIFLLRVFFA